MCGKTGIFQNDRHPVLFFQIDASFDTVHAIDNNIVITHTFPPLSGLKARSQETWKLLQSGYLVPARECWRRE
jgi:hypothetical protein